MTSPHCDPLANGRVFGQVTVTVDLDAGDCVVRAPRQGVVAMVPRSTRFHSLDEIRGAYQVQIGRAATDPVAKDIAAALKFAGQQIKAHQEGT
ncbi:hypothetical protein [Ruegeria sp. HKCCD8929]|uniref:hypothetical protein n=1 Tax=Ruegeria sp. HKCCD8929 TaxID=2683006 RepID=UPI001489C858|nr:hypothetical protein [Ruegeria sp. HKCCD8929]